MHKRNFISDVHMDCHTRIQVMAALSQVVAQLESDTRYSGYEPLWQTLTLSTEEYSVDDFSLTEPHVVQKYTSLTAEIMGVKE